MDLKKIETSIKICLQTAQNWLCKLRYEYKNVCKDVFIERYKLSDVVEDQNNFLTRKKDLKPYMVKFEGNGAMKPKIYLSDCKMESDNCQLIIVIIHGECTFSANNRIERAWTKIGDGFL